ncbi:uncharacterized protein LOC143148990 [Ptiloglossa arizonensis]|uniref:uncharacterized protein LOC143148990 n=1 Tax=Ptiloglossa arizonensis TaxID=3350558 RepID=UPI003FA17A1F
MANAKRKAKKRSNTPGRPRKRKFFGNQYTAKKKEASDSDTLAETTTGGDVINDSRRGYRTVHFDTVFTKLSALLICKSCKSDVKFDNTSENGANVKIIVQCDCGSKFIESPTIKSDD